MDMFTHLGVDMNNDTLPAILEQLQDKGVGNACIIPRGANDKALGMFLLLTDTAAIPYVEKALEQYNADCEQSEDE